MKTIEMNKLKTFVLLLLLIPEVHGQAVLTLEDCYERARHNYPLVSERDLIEKTKLLTLENISKGSLPHVSFGAQATYQSDVTQIPLDIPGVEPLSKDQYRVFGEISQTLYGGGLIHKKKEIQTLSAELGQQEVTVDLYQLRSRINDLYFGILLLQEQVLQSALVKEELNAVLKKTQVAIENGTALRSAADVLQAELLRVDQRIIEMESAEKTYRDILGLFIHETINDDTQLAKPSFSLTSEPIGRPELDLFDIQKKSLEANYGSQLALRKPRFELFVQGGYGRPGLNMLDNSFDFYGLGGLRFSWVLSSAYTSRNDRETFTLRQQSVDVKKQTFLFNTGLSLRQHESDISKYRRLIEVDDRIISLRKNVRETAAVQLEEGVITSTDFIQEVNAEDQAKQNRVLHEIQWLMAQAGYQFTSGQ